MGTLGMIFGGLLLLAGGAELLVRGAVAVARRLGMSPLLIGLTLVGFGTSSPELVTSVTAALTNEPAIAISNVVGSNISNILFVLGAAAALTAIRIDPTVFRRDAAWTAASALLLLGFALAGGIGRLGGAAMIVALVAYLLHVVYGARRQASLAARTGAVLAEHAKPLKGHPAVSVVVAVGGIALTIVGAALLVEGATRIALLVGASETVIGLTIVAIGTSLPEMTTSIVAALRGEADIAYGNVIGSNIFNILLVLGGSAVARPILVPAEIARFDIWVLMAATGLLIYFGWSGFRLTRREGAILIGAYAAYLLYLVIRSA